MEALLGNTSKQDQKMAKSFIAQLKDVPTVRKKNQDIEIKVGNQALPLKVPDKAFSFLVDIIENMAEGKPYVIILSDELLTSQQAADILNISRPYLVKLLDAGEIPFTKAGTHRRLRLKDILAYKGKMKVKRRKILDNLAKESQNLNLY